MSRAFHKKRRRQFLGTRRRKRWWWPISKAKKKKAFVDQKKKKNQNGEDAFSIHFFFLLFFFFFLQLFLHLLLLLLYWRRFSERISVRTLSLFSEKLWWREMMASPTHFLFILPTSTGYLGWVFLIFTLFSPTGRLNSWFTDRPYYSS